MRTCPNCGCYLPDKWIICPACDAKAKTNKETSSPSLSYNAGSKVSTKGTYQVKIYYRNGDTLSNIFGIREHALKSAKKMIDQFWYCIEVIEIFDCKAQKRIGLFYPNT